MVPGRWRGLGVGSPVVNLVPESRVTRVPVKSLRCIQFARSSGRRVITLISGAPVKVLVRTLLLLLGPEALLLFLKPRSSVGEGGGGNQKMISNVYSIYSLSKPSIHVNGIPMMSIVWVHHYLID